MLAIRLASASTSTSSSRTSPSSVVVMVLAPQKSGDGLRRHAERVGELLHVVKHHSLAASLDVRYTGSREADALGEVVLGDAEELPHLTDLGAKRDVTGFYFLLKIGRE